MEWTYEITAAPRPRVLVRLVQLFDQQALDIRSLQLTRFDGCVLIRLTVAVEAALARRLCAKLYHQVDVQEVGLVAGEDSAEAEAS
jgi:acetolactate synthase small subunit